MMLGSKKLPCLVKISINSPGVHSEMYRNDSLQNRRCLMIQKDGFSMFLCRKNVSSADLSTLYGFGREIHAFPVTI